MALLAFNGRLIAVCDECGPDYWYGPYSDEPPTFTAFDDAVHRLIDEFEWLIELSVGRALMLCKLCAAFECCVRRGWHDWAEFRNYGDVCVTCSIPREFDGVPDGHPDSTTADLSDEQEELLAALDAEIAEEAT